MSRTDSHSLSPGTWTCPNDRRTAAPVLVCGVGRAADLVAGETVWVNLDHAMQGIGSQSCGPGVLPQYRLDAAAAVLVRVLDRGVSRR